MGLYEFVIKDKAGKALASLNGARGRSFEHVLNNSGSAKFSLSANDPKLTPDLLLVGNKELFIYRAQTLIWGGELSYRSFSLSENDETFTLTAKGFFDLFSQKIVGSPITPVIHTNKDAGQIAVDEINAAQTGTNASFGFTIGSIPTTKNRNRSFDGQTLKQVIEGLSSTNINDGFDFEVDANKRFSVFNPKGIQLNHIVFEWGRNIETFGETQDATAMANQILVLGEGMGSAMKTSLRNASSTIQASYKIRQGKASYKDVSEQTTLDDHGDKELEQRQLQKQTITVRTKGALAAPYGSYQVGDSVKLKIKYGNVIDINQFMRIYAIKVTITDEDDEVIDFTLNQF